MRAKSIGIGVVGRSKTVGKVDRSHSFEKNRVLKTEGREDETWREHYFSKDKSFRAPTATGSPIRPIIHLRSPMLVSKNLKRATPSPKNHLLSTPEHRNYLSENTENPDHKYSRIKFIESRYNSHKNAYRLRREEPKTEDSNRNILANLHRKPKIQSFPEYYHKLRTQYSVDQ